MNPYLMAAGGVLQLAGTGMNIYRSNKFMDEAERQLRDLENNPIEPYKASTQLNTAYAGARAGASAPKGMSMEDVNRFMINQARNENTALANANKMGGGRGNLSILNAGLSGMSSDLASKSAAIAQQNRLADTSRAASLSGTYQSLSNMNVNANMQAQQAYGQAIRQQRQNISNAWSSIANMGGMMAGYGMMKGSPAKTGVETTTGAGTTEGAGYDNIGLNYTKPNMYPALNSNYNFNPNPTLPSFSSIDPTSNAANATGPLAPNYNGYDLGFGGVPGMGYTWQSYLKPGFSVDK
jgi:hypothetical protein